MPNDHTYLYELNEAFRQGMCSDHSPAQVRFSLEEYMRLAGEFLGVDLFALTPAQVSDLSKNHDYPYWFLYRSHICDGEEREYLMVDVKEPWYLLYLQQQERWESMTPEEQEQHDPLQSFRELGDYMTRIANIHNQAPKN